MPFTSTPGPTVAIEIAPRQVTAVAIARRGGQVAVTGHASEPLPEGAVVAALTTPNIADRGAVVQAVKNALLRAGARSRRIGLVVPDSLAKVSLLRFEKVPARADDLEQLIRWQVRKTAPFRIEDAQVAHTPGLTLPDGGREFVVALARRDIIAEYEDVANAAGAHAGIVDLATFNLINVVLASANGGQARRIESGPSTDWLLVHVTPDYSTIAIVRQSDLVFFRNRRIDDGDLADMAHQTSMYYQDRLGGSGFARIVLAGATSGGGTWSLGEAEQVRRTLEVRLGARVEAIDPRAAATLRDRITASPELLDSLASPLGLLLRAES
jgi:Tfp pilus assembly PilM family ATPase